MAWLLCAATLLITYVAARRSLLGGVVATIAIGYIYGVVRANVTHPATHFIYDCAVLGLYAAQLQQFRRQYASKDEQRLKHWVILLMLWPTVLFFVPLQDPLIQFVGLRGNIFLLPFILLGANFEDEDWYKLAGWLSAMNIGALLFAGIEILCGVETFFPPSAVTEIILRSNDVGSLNALRIPSSFSSAHSYGGAMVITLPIIIGAWVQRRGTWRKQTLLLAGIGAGIVGVLLSAARMHFILTAIVLAVFMLTARVRLITRVSFAVVLLTIACMASHHERMQRFTTLSDTSYVATRFGWSVNNSFIDDVVNYPFGNGLGGGGTSIPFFLADRVRRGIYNENEYARIVLETGLIGLCLWIAFIVWVLSRILRSGTDGWTLGRRLAWTACIALFCAGMVGTGLLTAVPQSSLFLMLLGWIVGPQPATSPAILSPAFYLQPSYAGD